VDSMLQIFESGDTTLMWLGAVAAAAVGTALIVGVYLRSMRRRAGARDAAGRPAANAPLAAARGLAAYQAQKKSATGASMQRQADFTRTDMQPSEPVTEASLAALEELLGRVQRAAGTLEDLAGRTRRPSRPAGVEYLHRTV